MTGFVDDITVLVKQTKNSTLQQKINSTMTKIEDYLKANRLSQNVSKTKLSIISDNVNLRKNTTYTATDTAGKQHTIKHQNNSKILGVSINRKLSWNHHLIECKNSIKKQLTQRLSVVKLIAKNSTLKFAKQFANGAINSKLLYGIELWANTTKHNINTLQKIQDNAVKYLVGWQPENQKKSTRQLYKELNWYNITDLHHISTMKLTNKIYNTKTPQYLSTQMRDYTDRKSKNKTNRKLAPMKIGKRMTNIRSFKTEMQNYNNLPYPITKITNNKFFTKQLKKHMRDPRYLPDQSKFPKQYYKDD